ncbi:NADP oxidoreductase [Streptomyces sp. V2]|uniref:NADPH-dependent F420 reductase n=1 Tax=Streptomyces TaxID=1883 RepID=UPI0006EB5B5A|nr:MULTISPECIES: NAD(P)-binding domain-containing protein [Streptomyces]PWG14250.1 NADP oxidoreductase [Streptomyces sp. V2]
MRIGIVGTGAIGATLARKLGARGHDVTVANSRGPHTVPADALASGARAATAAEAVRDRDVIILSVPFTRLPALAELLSSTPEETVVIDTSNYYPHLNGTVEAVDDGQVESLWAAERLGRPVVKAWNAALAATLRTKGAPAGTSGRIAIPVAADSDESRRLAMRLVDDTGFDPYDAGALADSWRQQPMGPAYCTELTLTELAPAKAAADRHKDIRVRDSLPARLAALGDTFTHEDVVEMNRAAHR